MSYSYALYPGLHIEHLDMVISHGVQPSVCCAVAYPDGTVSPNGTLQLIETDGTKISFLGCAVEGAIATSEELRRGQRLRVKIYDRRWSWKYAKIDGEYNRPLPGGLVDSSTKASYWELIALLLQAIGEQIYTIVLPDIQLTPPYVRWSSANAASELSRLVERIGCRIVLGLDNKVYVGGTGLGSVIPPQGTEILRLMETQRGSMPASITTSFGDTKWQSKLKLEAVGIDTDGDIKKIDDLAYKPTNGWEYEWPHTMPNMASTSQMLALETVFRWYRISEFDNGTLFLPGGYKVERIESINPVSRKLLTTRTSNTLIQAEDAYHIGSWYRGDLKGDNQADNTRVDIPFELDSENGIVKFSEPVYKVSSNEFKQADLYLTASYGTGRYYSRSISTGIPGSRGEAGISNRTMFRSIIQNYSAGQPLSYKNISDNRSALSDYAIRHIAAYSHKFNTRNQGSMQWVGLEPISCSGVIHTVRWSIGYGKATTYATKNVDDWTTGPTFDQMRHVDKLDRLADDGVSE